MLTDLWIIFRERGARASVPCAAISAAQLQKDAAAGRSVNACAVPECPNTLPGLTGLLNDLGELQEAMCAKAPCPLCPGFPGLRELVPKHAARRLT